MAEERAVSKTLVSSPTSQQNPFSPYSSYFDSVGIKGFQFFKKSLRILRESPLASNSVPPVGKTINGFSYQSKRRLKHLCMNSNTDFISQVCLTYHEKPPITGKEVKAHLNRFLNFLRRENIKYLWVLEFQDKRAVKAPHLHIFLDVPVSHRVIYRGQSISLRRRMGMVWNRITKETKKHFKVHTHKKNFIPWRMNDGTYLVKQYLSKESQKQVPEGFTDVGRFWGSSSGLVDYYVLDADSVSGNFPNLEEKTGELKTEKQMCTYFLRVLRKHHEKTNRFLSSYKRRTTKPSTKNNLFESTTQANDNQTGFEKFRDKKIKVKSKLRINVCSVYLPFGAVVANSVISYFGTFQTIPF